MIYLLKWIRSQIPQRCWWCLYESVKALEGVFLIIHTFRLDHMLDICTATQVQSINWFEAQLFWVCKNILRI